MKQAWKSVITIQVGRLEMKIIFLGTKRIDAYELEELGIRIKR